MPWPHSGRRSAALEGGPRRRPLGCKTPSCFHRAVSIARMRLARLAHVAFSHATLCRMRFDLHRLRTRLRRLRDRDVVPRIRGFTSAGSRRVPGWLNVDVRGSDYDIDLASGRLPWRTNTVACVVSQHTIEHLKLHTQLVPLLRAWPSHSARRKSGSAARASTRSAGLTSIIEWRTGWRIGAALPGIFPFEEVPART